MEKEKRTLEDHFEDRDKLDKEYWKRSDELQDEYDALMKELESE